MHLRRPGAPHDAPVAEGAGPELHPALEPPEHLLTREQELRILNASAVASLDEGLEEILTPHRLGLFETLGCSLKTTNSLESMMAHVGQRTDQVDRWRTSDQKHCWVATALLDIEPRLRHIKTYRHLPLLPATLQREIAAATGGSQEVA